MTKASSSSPVLEIHGLSLGDTTWPRLRLFPGELAYFAAVDSDEALLLCDFILGLPVNPTTPLCGDVLWFGETWPPTQSTRHLAALRRAFPLVPGGGLLSNITLGENILLPAFARQPLLEREGESLLAEVLEGEGTSFHIGPRDLGLLPHRVGPRRRHAAALLQAWLCKPDLIFCVDFCRPELGKIRASLVEGLTHLRRLLPNAAWLFIGPETGLPDWVGSATPMELSS